MRIGYTSNCATMLPITAGGGQCKGGQSTCTSCASCVACTNRCKRSAIFQFDTLNNELKAIYTKKAI